MQRFLKENYRKNLALKFIRINNVTYLIDFMFNLLKKYFKKEPENHPDFWKEYLSHFENRLDKKRSLHEYRFVVFDTETTGFFLKKDRICQIGAVGITDNTIRLKDFFNTLVIQDTGGIGEIKEIHGLLDKDIHTGMNEKEAVTEFIKYLNNAIIVAHHAAFDVGMINQALKRHFGGSLKLKNKSIDTAHLERRLTPNGAYAVENWADYSLDALAEKYGIMLHDRHTGIGDAFITAQLFFKITARLEKRGVISLGDLLKK
jgi:DNA polymerase-3 subunit epsilon